MSAERELDLWVEERHKGLFSFGFRVTGTLFSGRSAYQTVDVVATAGHGRMLLNDGLIMISERDEFIYHEMIAHVPLFIHPAAERVLVIGGGDGGTVREVLRHPEVKECWLVEIDAMVIDACRRFIPFTAPALDDARTRIRIEDGVRFVAETRERFDVVIVDSTDPIGPAAPLFGDTFYAGVEKLLTRDGIVVAQAGSPFYEPKEQRSLAAILRRRFPAVRPYTFTNLTYPGGFWCFVFASKGLCPLKDFDDKRFERRGFGLRYYNQEIHRAAFALPEFMRRDLGAEQQ